MFFLRSLRFSWCLLSARQRTKLEWFNLPILPRILLRCLSLSLGRSMSFLFKVSVQGIWSFGFHLQDSITATDNRIIRAHSLNLECLGLGGGGSMPMEEGSAYVYIQNQAVTYARQITPKNRRNPLIINYKWVILGFMDKWESTCFLDWGQEFL